MTNEYQLSVEFRTPDAVDEESVRLVLNEYFGDLVKTERFIDARIIDDGSLSDGDVDRLEQMFEQLSEEDVELAEDVVDEMSSDQ